MGLPNPDGQLFKYSDTEVISSTPCSSVCDLRPVETLILRTYVIASTRVTTPNRLRSILIRMGIQGRKDIPNPDIASCCAECGSTLSARRGPWPGTHAHNR